MYLKKFRKMECSIFQNIFKSIQNFTWICLDFFQCQGRRRVFKSGPAEEIIECRRHERRQNTRGGWPLLLGGLRGLPRENFEFLALLCVYLIVFYAFGTRFQSRFFARKDISWRVRKPIAKQNRFQIVTIFFLLFSSAYFLDILSPMFPQVFAKYF